MLFSRLSKIYTKRAFSARYCPEFQRKTLSLYNCYELNMNIDNLDIVKQLIAEKENGQVEFKETTGQLERGMETLCAFLNSEGGTVLFGVTDKGKIIGQEVSDKTKRDIAEAIRRFEPFATLEVSYISIQNTDKSVIAFVCGQPTLYASVLL